MEEKEKIRRDLLERYLSTGKVGLIRPASDSEAIDLIETVVDLYNSSQIEEPVKLSLSEMSAKFKDILDF